MMPDPVLLFATVILLLPMGYCLLAAPAFLLVRLDIPPVTQLLRGLFNAYFLLLAIAGVIGTVAFAVEGRLVATVGVAVIAAFAVVARRWFLRRMDADLNARDAGDPEGGAAAAPAALGWHAVQRGRACHHREQHSLYRGPAGIADIAAAARTR